MKCCGYDHVYLSVKNTSSDLKLLDNYDNEEAWKSAVNKRKFLFAKIFREYDQPELSEPEDNDDSQTEQQQQTNSKVNKDQGGGCSGGNSKLNVNLVSPLEQVALRAEDALLCEGRNCELDSFTPADTAEIENMRKPRSTWAHLVIFILEILN